MRLFVFSPICFMVGLSSLTFGGIFLALWLPRKGNSYNMDPLEKWGSFEPHIKRYQELAKLILTLATATIAFVTNFLINLQKTSPVNAYGSRLERAAPWALGLLCSTVLWTITFMLVLSYFYEEYTHFNYLPREPAWQKLRDRGLYWAWKSSVVWSLAVVGMLSFFAAYVVIALGMFA